MSHIQPICMYESKKMLADVHPTSTEEHGQTKVQHILQVTYDTQKCVGTTKTTNIVNGIHVRDVRLPQLL
jgi:hypothetical protein